MYYYNKKKRVQVQYPKQQNSTKVFHHYQQQQHVLFHHTCVSELMSGENRRETTSSFSPKNFVVVTQSLSKSDRVNKGYVIAAPFLITYTLYITARRPNKEKGRSNVL